MEKFMLSATHSEIRRQHDTHSLLFLVRGHLTGSYSTTYIREISRRSITVVRRLLSFFVGRAGRLRGHLASPNFLLRVQKADRRDRTAVGSGHVPRTSSFNRTPPICFYGFSIRRHIQSLAHSPDRGKGFFNTFILGGKHESDSPRRR